MIFRMVFPSWLSFQMPEMVAICILRAFWPLWALRTFLSHHMAFWDRRFAIAGICNPLQKLLTSLDFQIGHLMAVWPLQFLSLQIWPKTSCFIHKTFHFILSENLEMDSFKHVLLYKKDSDPGILLADCLHYFWPTTCLR
jgi:hypothetical protein